MSRVGKKPIQIPQGVEGKIDGKRIIVKGPKGELSRAFPPEIKVEVREDKILVTLQTETQKQNKSITGQARETKALWGLTRALIANMVKGITEGYEKKLEIEGLGYKASLEGNDLLLYVGFTHPVKIKTPPGIKILVEKNIIRVLGTDKELVGQISAKIRKVRPPEPYKGKGIKYLGEVIRRKAGKKVVTTTGG